MADRNYEILYNALKKEHAQLSADYKTLTNEHDALKQATKNYDQIPSMP